MYISDPYTMKVATCETCEHVKITEAKLTFWHNQNTMAH